MPMRGEIARLTKQPFVYNFEQGPAQVPDEATALRQGLNCVALAHLALRDLLAIDLPPSMHCYEMYSDTKHFQTLESAQALQTGDLVWFGWRRPHEPPETFKPSYDEHGYLTNWKRSPVTHVALFTGDRAENGDPLMLHATHITGGNDVWPLSRFADYRRYREIKRLARPIC